LVAQSVHEEFPNRRLLSLTQADWKCSLLRLTGAPWQAFPPCELASPANALPRVLAHSQTPPASSSSPTAPSEFATSYTPKLHCMISSSTSTATGRQHKWRAGCRSTRTLLPNSRFSSFDFRFSPATTIGALPTTPGSPATAYSASLLPESPTPSIQHILMYPRFAGSDNAS